MIAGRGGYVFPYDDLFTFVSRGAHVNLFFENGEEMKLEEINDQLKTHLLLHENNFNMNNLASDQRWDEDPGGPAQQLKQQTINNQHSTSNMRHSNILNDDIL